MTTVILKMYVRGLGKALHFYFKPGLRYQRYPGSLDPQTNKYVKIWLKYVPGTKRGIRKVWETYNQIICEKDLNKFKLLLKRVEDMLKTVEAGGSFHISMSKSEEALSLKRLAMNIYYEIGLLYECCHDYNAALDNYDRASQIVVNYQSGMASLRKIRDKVYQAIQFLLARRKEKTQYDVLIVNVGMVSQSIPWALIVLGTKLLKEGRRVRLMDGYSQESRILKEASYSRLIGFSVMTAQIDSSLRLSREIKRLYPDKFIVWGGVHPTLFAEQCLKEGVIDFVITGDGEDALTNLTTCLENKDYSFNNISGLGFKNNGAIVINPMGKPARFEDAGPWKIELLDMRNYMSWSIALVDFKYPSMGFLATRGCPRGCAFCINSIVRHTRIYRAKSVECVLDEIEQLIAKYNARTINFSDEAFLVNSNYFNSLVEGITKRSLKFEWGGGAHISDILRNKDLILKAKKAGLIYIGGSGESGSNRLLRLMKKNITVEDTLECMHFLADNGLMTASNFMTHLPTETVQERKATLALIKMVKDIFKEKNNPSFIMGPSVFRPYPGSEFYDMCLKSGFKEPQTLEDWGRMILPDGHFKFDNITWLG